MSTVDVYLYNYSNLLYMKVALMSNQFLPIYTLY